MKKIFIFGYYGFDNAGDDAILETIVRELKKRDEELSIDILTYNYERTAQIPGINPISRSKMFSMLNAIRKSDLVISGGGTLMQDITSSRSLYFYLGIIVLAKLLGKKVMFFCNGMGPINKNLNNKLLKLILKKIDFMTLRDEKSMAFLKRLGVAKKAKTCADTAFLMESAERRRIDDIMKIEGIDDTKQVVGISVRKWFNDENTIEVMSRFIDELGKQNKEVVLFPMMLPDDVEIAEEIQKRSGTKFKILAGKYTPAEIAGIVGRCESIIGMRLHFLIFGSIFGVPMIGLEYDPRVGAFIESVDQINGGRINKIEKLEFEQLMEQYEMLNEHRAVYKKNLEKCNAVNSKKIEEAFDILFGLLES